ncbi:MAG: polymer-forming cytoskeletal protein [Nitrospinota bacterium]
MWDRKETDRERKDLGSARNEPPRKAVAPDPQPRQAGQAKIGQSLFIKGDVTGSEDLTVEGRVEGRIDLKDHNLTIGPNGRVHAEIHARNISIVGEVTGNVVADEKVELTDTARLIGDIRAPRIAVSDGAKFKGSVDMVQAQTKHEKLEKTQVAGNKEQAKGKNVAAQTAQMGQAAKSVQ